MKYAIASALCLLGCGKELHQTVDAQPVDSTTDVTIPDNGEPPAEAVKLTLTRYGVGVPGASVLFLDSESVVLAAGITDMTGRAWALMAGGGSVTVVEHMGPTLDELTTFGAVVNGDALRLDNAPLGIGMDRMLDISVPLDAGASSYTIHTACGTGGADVTGAGTIDLTNCGTLADVAVRSYDSDGLFTGRVLYSAAATLPATGQAAISGVYQTLEPSMLTYTNVPSEVQLVNSYQAVSIASRAFETSDNAAPSAGGATVTLAIPGASEGIVTVTTLYPASSEVGQQQTYDWDSVGAKTFTSNLATALLPAYSTVPAYDLAAHSVTWTERAGGTPADVVRVGMQLYRDDIPNGRAWRWRLAAPRTGTSVKFPTLPPVAGYDFNPTVGDSFGIDDLTSMRLPGGLAPWRATIFAPLAQTLTGTSGHAAVQTLYVPEL